MLSLFDAIKDNFKPRFGKICIDNLVFRLHYKATTIIFFVATILVSSREYIGEHIRCITDMNRHGFEKVIERFCFFTSTFTVVSQQELDFLRYGFNSRHKGVLPYSIGSQIPIKKHMYYQWVPYMLFGQGIMFYLTHLLWKKIENNTIHKLVYGLTNARYALLDKSLDVGNSVIPSKDDRYDNITKIKKTFLHRISLSNSWSRGLIFCELLNLGHIILQFALTNKFLGHEFTNLGPSIFVNGSEILDEVFPKMTKCIFHTCGPSGSIQVHDALCVMALNVINEKIYVFLWFWFVVLFACSCLILLWRVLSAILYSRCMLFNQFCFGHYSKEKLSSWNLRLVLKRCNYCDWLLLRYLSKNLDALTFKELFAEISEDLEERKPLFMVRGEKSDSNKFN